MASPYTLIMKLGCTQMYEARSPRRTAPVRGSAPSLTIGLDCRQNRSPFSTVYWR